MAAPEMPADEARRRLREFLDQLKTLLDDFVKSPRAVPGRFHESMKAAWKEIEPKFEDADKELDSNASALSNNLETQGLAGPQLIFKLSVFRHARDELADHTARSTLLQDDRWWNRWRGLFKYTLKAADVILGSLAKVVPVLEPIKEFKEALETAVLPESNDGK